MPKETDSILHKRKTIKADATRPLERKPCYQRLCVMKISEFASVDSLDRAHRKTKLGKRYKPASARFCARETENLIALSKRVSSGRYRPAPLDRFVIFEPKEREICAPSYRDKIIQKALTDDIVYPALSPSIPFNSFASQKGKGQHKAVKVLEDQMRTYFLRNKALDEAYRKEKGLGYRSADEWDYNRGWVVKGDIRKFFPSSDHNRIFNAVAGKLDVDDALVKLLESYLTQVDGLALGHQTSHICAVYYVSSALHYLNQELGCSLSGMYMDDWYAIVETKRQAKDILAAMENKFHELGYELNEKTGIFPLSQGIDYCGFHVYITKRGKVISKLRQSSRRKEKRRIRKWAKDYHDGLITREEIEMKFQSWCAHAKHGNTHKLIGDMRDRVNQIYKENPKYEQKNKYLESGKYCQYQRKWRKQAVHFSSV